MIPSLKCGFIPIKAPNNCRGIKYFLIFLLFISFACAANCAPGKARNKYAQIISASEAKASIIIGDNPEARAAAVILKETLEKMSAAHDISILPESEACCARGTNIFLKKDVNSSPLTPDTRDIDNSLKFKFKIYPGSIHILYPDDKSAINAVGIFLRKFCGVRFFVPAAIGSEIPRHESLKIRTGSYEVNPSFKGRNLGIYGDENFAKLIGHSPTFTASNHFMPQIVDAKISALNPAWMAKIDGKLQRHTSSAQVDFANGAMRMFVKEYADRYFEKNPRAEIFPLTPADSSDFDNTPYSQRMKRGLTPSGYMDCSNLVFSFTNEIARFIRKKHPSKFVYSLAYLYTENPPSFKISDNIIVYLCADRGNFFLKENMEADSKLLKEWSNSGTRFFGIYDYNYGKPYFIPRNTFQQIAYSIKNAYGAGARFYTCESSPNWAYDAHKIWLISNLLMDTSSDPKKLADEFFEAYYKEASKHISSFFEIAQQQWNQRSDRPMWLTLFKRWEQAEIFTKESLERMEEELAAAESSANSPLVAERVREIRLMFDITKSFENTYRLQKKLWTYDVCNTPKKDILDTIEAVKISKTIQRLLVKKYAETTKYPIVSFKIWDDLDYMDPSEMLSAKILEEPGEKSANLLKEPDFERAFTDANSLWNSRKSDSANLKIIKSNGSLSLSAWLPAYLYQIARVSEGRRYSFALEASGNLEIGAVFYIELSFHDESGKTLSKKRLRIPPLGSFAGKEISVLGLAPKGSIYATAAIFAISMRNSDFVEIKNAALIEHKR